MAKPLTEALYAVLLVDVGHFVKNDFYSIPNKFFIKMLQELTQIVDECKEGLQVVDWKRQALVLLDKLNQIYQRIPYDRWFHAYGSGVALRAEIEKIFENTLGVKPSMGYFSNNLIPVGDLDIAIDKYVGNPF